MVLVRLEQVQEQLQEAQRAWVQVLEKQRLASLELELVPALEPELVQERARAALEMGLVKLELLATAQRARAVAMEVGRVGR